MATSKQQLNTGNNHIGTKSKVDRDVDEDSTESIVPPDGGWGWMVVFGSFMIHIITDGVTYSFGVFYDEFLNYFNEGKAATSWILSILVGVTLCSGPLSSALVNRYGCRMVTILGSIFACISMVATVFAKNIVTLYFTIGLGTGLGFGLIYLPAIVSVTTYFERKRSLATGIAVCGSGFGTFIFASVITKLLAEYSWRGSMLIIAGIVLQCVIFGLMFRPLNRQQSSEAVPPPESKAIPSDSLIIDNWSAQKSTTEANTINPTAAEPHTNSISNHVANHYGKSSHHEIARMTVSHPVLSNQMEKSNYSRPHIRNNHLSHSFHRAYGPLDNPHVFYQGSLKNIASYKSRTGSRRDIVSHIALSKAQQSNNINKQRTDVVLCGIFRCTQKTWNTVHDMFNLNLLCDSLFIVFTISNFLTSIGFNVPYVYIVSRAKSLNLTSDEASMLLSIIGIANTMGRIVLGYISDKTWVNRLHVYNWSLMICGTATFLSAFCTTFLTLAIYSSIFGFTIGAYVGLTSVILVDLLGLDKLTNAFGVLLLFQGIASLIGPPIAGALYDATASYGPGFYMAGISIACSGLILFIIPVIQRYRTKNESADPEDSDTSI